VSYNNLGLNLCIVPTIYHIVIILNDQGEVRKWVLENSWLGLSQFPDYRLQSIYLVLYTESIVGTVAKK